MSQETRFPRIAALIACHNRKNLTLSSIAALIASAHGAADLEIFLVDDGSDDGTSEEVSSRFPDVNLIRGDGDLFWNGAMRLGWSTALNHGPFDFYLWLNDDLALYEHAIPQILLDYAKYQVAACGKLIMVGATLSNTGAVTYGGLSRNSGISRLRFRPVSSEAEKIVTMNGNCVLIPSRAVDDIGINSSSFTHAFGDIDYGLRATASGYRIYQSSNPVGEQERGPSYSRMKGKGLRALLQYANSPKGMPWREWGAFCLRHGGILAPLNFASMYLNQIRQKEPEAFGGE